MNANKDDEEKSWYDKLRPIALLASIGLVAIGVSAAMFDIALDQVIEQMRSDVKQKEEDDT